MALRIEIQGPAVEGPGERSFGSYLVAESRGSYRIDASRTGVPSAELEVEETDVLELQTGDGAVLYLSVAGYQQLFGELERGVADGVVAISPRLSFAEAERGAVSDAALHMVQVLRLPPDEAATDIASSF